MVVGGCCGGAGRRVVGVDRAAGVALSSRRLTSAVAWGVLPWQGWWAWLTHGDGCGVGRAGAARGTCRLSQVRPSCRSRTPLVRLQGGLPRARKHARERCATPGAWM